MLEAYPETPQTAYQDEFIDAILTGQRADWLCDTDEEASDLTQNHKDNRDATPTPMPPISSFNVNMPKPQSSLPKGGHKRRAKKGFFDEAETSKTSGKANNAVETAAMSPESESDPPSAQGRVPQPSAQERKKDQLAVLLASSAPPSQRSESVVSDSQETAPSAKPKKQERHNVGANLEKRDTKAYRPERKQNGLTVSAAAAPRNKRNPLKIAKNLKASSLVSNGRDDRRQAADDATDDANGKPNPLTSSEARGDKSLSKQVKSTSSKANKSTAVAEENATVIANEGHKSANSVRNASTVSTRTRTPKRRQAKSAPISYEDVDSDINDVEDSDAAEEFQSQESSVQEDDIDQGSDGESSSTISSVAVKPVPHDKGKKAVEKASIGASRRQRLDDGVSLLTEDSPKHAQDATMPKKTPGDPHSATVESVQAVPKGRQLLQSNSPPVNISTTLSDLLEAEATVQSDAAVGDKTSYTNGAASKASHERDLVQRLTLAPPAAKPAHENAVRSFSKPRLIVQDRTANRSRSYIDIEPQQSPHQHVGRAGDVRAIAHRERIHVVEPARETQDSPLRAIWRPSISQNGTKRRAMLLPEDHSSDGPPDADSFQMMDTMRPIKKLKPNHTALGALDSSVPVINDGRKGFPQYNERNIDKGSRAFVTPGEMSERLARTTELMAQSFLTHFTEKATESFGIIEEFTLNGRSMLRRVAQRRAQDCTTSMTLMARNGRAIETAAGQASLAVQEHLEFLRSTRSAHKLRASDLLISLCQLLEA